MYASIIFPVLCGTNKILREVVLLFYSNFFQSFECDGKYISFQLYWSMKGLIFDILWRLFFNVLMKAYWKQLSSLFFGFIVAFLFFNHLGQSIYDPPLFKSFFEGDNTINQYYQEQSRFLSLVLLFFLIIL